MCIHVLLLPTTGTSLSSFWHVYGLKQSGRAWYQLLSTLVECGFEQCLVDPCVFRLMVSGDAVAVLAFDLDDIKIAATEKVTDVVV